MSDEIAVGIELGTSTSCVAASVGVAKPRALLDEWGDRMHASVVSFLGADSSLVGGEAKRNVLAIAESAVWSAKRLSRRTARLDPRRSSADAFGVQ